jgi:arsenite/tail-anchored protein-transporting ATPase
VSLEGLDDSGVRLVMVGGKGGVGKTTCASAVALHLTLTGRKVLIVSSDPTPSLSDIFDLPVGHRETKIDPRFELYGLEISSELVLKRWKERFGPEIFEVVSSFADVDYDFVDYIGTVPGIEEEYMLHFIRELVESDRYDTVVWDTAPAGHTLRLLKLPHLFIKHMEAATKFYMNMYSYAEKLKEAVRFGKSKRTLLQIISGWEDLSLQIVDFIRDEIKSRYLLVTIPEALGVKLTERMVAELQENELSVSNIIINYVVQHEDCTFHQVRKRMQERYMGVLHRTHPDINMVTLYLSAEEVRGIDRIETVSAALFGNSVR